jgi:hypothetical protein
MRLHAVHALARAYAATGRTNDAIALLEHATESGRACGGLAAVLAWFDARSDLIDLYNSAGRAADARRVHGELTRLLEFADDNHIVKRRLAQLAPKVARRSIRQIAGPLTGSRDSSYPAGTRPGGNPIPASGP